jgi:hypothetical protein
MTNPYAPSSAPMKEPPLSAFQRARRLPFSNWWPTTLGALIGIALRIVFNRSPEQAYTAMLGSFIAGSPLIVGVVTVYLAELEERRSWKYYIFAPMLATCLYVLGTLAILVEGWICALLIFPLFAVIGAVGGVVMGLICRMTNWPRGRIVSGLVLLALAGGAIEPRVPTSDYAGVQERSVFVAAPPDAVWRELVDTPRIRAAEVDSAWMYRIGVPVPTSGAGEYRDGEHVRHILMGKGVHFEQVASEWRVNERVTWNYRFAANSFPAGALDDHVRIGGKYFDLGGTTYALRAEGTGTRLTVTMRYRVSTHFNFYAARVGDLLVGDFAEKIVQFYARRAQRSAAPQPAVESS